MVLVYLINGKFFPAITQLKFAGMFMVSLMTIQLLISNFQGIIEWYRTIGGIVVSFMIAVLYIDTQNKDKDKQIIWLMFAGLFPVVAFYTGFWSEIYEGNIRKTFLSHDPNHLAHLLVYGVIATYYTLRSNESKWLKRKYLIPIVIAFFFPIAFTFSRTSLFALVCVSIIYVIIVLESKYKKYILALVILAGITATSLVSVDNVIIAGFTERFDEGDEDRSGYFKSSTTVIENNFITGVGISKFRNEEWRVANGFSRKDIDLETGDYVDVSTASHNGFFDILMMGGIGLFISFLIIILYPAYFMFTNKFEDTLLLKYHKFIVYSLCISFVLTNLTYSLYNSKLGWFGIAFSYLVIAPYYFYKKTRPSLIKQRVFKAHSYD